MILLVLFSGSVFAEGWKAGVAKVKITPEESVWMGGYGFRDHPSEGVLVDIWAKALVMEDASGGKAVLVTMDLVGISKIISDSIRDRLQKEYGFSRSQIILSVSHTHTGPALEGNLIDAYPINSKQLKKTIQYSNNLVKQIVCLTGDALHSMHPVSLSSGNGITRFQVNRRNNKENELTSHTELKGPNDYAVPVLKVADEDGKLVAIVFGYACHGTVLSVYKFSGDYMGYAQLNLEKKYPGVVAMFFQGTAGDQNPIPRRSVALAKQYGGELACAVERVLNEKTKSLSPELKTSYSEINLPMEASPTSEELESIAKNTNADYVQRWALRLLKQKKAGVPFRTDYPYPIELWSLGDQLIVAMGGEPTIKYDINIKGLLGERTFVMGYSNDVMSYIPTAKIIKEGGYEAKTSQQAYGLPSTWKPQIEEMILKEVVTLAGDVGFSEK